MRLKETISITDEDGKVYEFEKPEFKCELLKVVHGLIIGYVVIGGLSVRSHTWLRTGECFFGTEQYKNFYLTPIAK